VSRRGACRNHDSFLKYWWSSDVDFEDKSGRDGYGVLVLREGISMVVDKSSEGLRRHSGRLPLHFDALVIWFLVIVVGVAFWALLVPAVAPLIVKLVHHILQAQIPPKLAG
jgi:hypothetical protein